MNNQSSTTPDDSFATGTSTVWYQTIQSGVSTTSSNDGCMVTAHALTAFAVYWYQYRYQVPYGTTSYAGYRSLRLRCTGTVHGTAPTQLPGTVRWLLLTALAVRTVRYTKLRWLQFTAFAVRTKQYQYTQLRWLQLSWLQLSSLHSWCV